MFTKIACKLEETFRHIKIECTSNEGMVNMQYNTAENGSTQ